MALKRITSVFLLLYMIGATLTSYSAEEGPIAAVKTVPLSRRAMVQSLTGWGTVVTGAAQENSLAVPRAGQITNLRVIPGQKVRRGDILFEFSTSSTEHLAFEQASSAVSYAKAELQRTQRLFEQNLATNSQLATASKVLTDAEAALAEQNRRNSDRLIERISAPFDGIVTTVSVARGDFLGAGVPVMKLAQPEMSYVQLGIEPEQIDRVKVGMLARITPLFSKEGAAGARVSAVHGIVNPQTRLIDVMLHIDHARGTWPLGTKVQGEILLQSQAMPAVPRSAVLRDGKGAYVFQVDHGRARRVDVVTGMDDGKWVTIEGKLNNKFPVVVVGNYELQDEMTVRESAQ